VQLRGGHGTTLVHVEFLNQAGEVTGSIGLANGVAVPDNHRTAMLLSGMNIVDPTDGQLVDMKEGPKYLNALLANFRGAYLWARLVE
jgi:hypothetical protein